MGIPICSKEVQDLPLQPSENSPDGLESDNEDSVSLPDELVEEEQFGKTTQQIDCAIANYEDKLRLTEAKKFKTAEDGKHP